VSSAGNGPPNPWGAKSGKLLDQLRAQAPPAPPPPLVEPSPAKKPDPILAEMTVCAKAKSKQERKDLDEKEALAIAEKIQKRGFPLGFTSMEEFQQCMDDLINALKDSDIPWVAVGVRGSSVTFFSRNPSKKGNYFDSNPAEPSDIDVFVIVGQRTYLKAQPNANGFVHPDKMKEKYPALGEWSQKWSAKLQREKPATDNEFRPISVGGWKPGAAKASSSKGSKPPDNSDSIFYNDKR
jgi:hypothetical protein